MSKILDNKQIVHIAAEVVVLLGITFFFSQKNKKIMNHINDLSQRIEDQEDIIQKYEQIISNLSKKVEEHEQKILFIQNNMNSKIPNLDVQVPQNINLQQNIEAQHHKQLKSDKQVQQKTQQKKSKNINSKNLSKENINSYNNLNQINNSENEKDAHVLRRTINIEKTLPVHTIFVGNIPKTENLQNNNRVVEIIDDTEDIHIKDEENHKEDDKDDEDDGDDEDDEELLDAELEEELKDLN
jgi:hypothetical protein